LSKWCGALCKNRSAAPAGKPVQAGFPLGQLREEFAGPILISVQLEIAMPLASAACRLAGIVLLAVLPAAHAAGPPPQAAADAIAHAMQAVVGLQVTAAEDARSADTLGEEREGSGVVIGPDGLILTIGYLIVEADTIEVTTSDNRVVPARAIG